MSPAGRRAVDLAERFVAGLSGESERWTAFEAAGMALDEAADLWTYRAEWCAYRLVQLAAERDSPATWDDDLAAQIAQTAPEAFAWTGSQWDEGVLEAHRRAIADWVRDIFGNPFRPVSFDPSWRTPGVVRLAQTIYDGRTFDQMPELADVLAGAGCHDADILAHCRAPIGHLRGCWVVDAFLGLT
jgi:hypothetical protein